MLLMPEMDSNYVVQVNGRFLSMSSQMDGDGDNNNNDRDVLPKNRFQIKGIAFPNLPPHQEYNETAWIDVLKQLRQWIPDPEALNTVRLYQLQILGHERIDYSGFFQAAAELGFYVMVPMTASTDGAVLNRLAKPPKCYKKGLYKYGTRVLDLSLQHSNVIAGLLGNEVMNDRRSWLAAPCLKAYARDLKQFMAQVQAEVSRNATLAQRYQARIVNGKLVPLPLMYASQDSGIGAALTNVDALRLTMDYLSCHNGDSSCSIDIFGINVESWCSSHNSFEFQDDGVTTGSYLKLWLGLHSAQHLPMIFSELGCSHQRFNRDAPAAETKRIRDWKQVPVVLNQMGDAWSGFSAYAYWGNSLFNMFEGGPWDGNSLLQPGPDFENFANQCLEAAASRYIGQDSNHTARTTTLHNLPLANGGVMEEYYQLMQKQEQWPPSCARVEQVLSETLDLELASWSKIHSYFEPEKEVSPSSESLLSSDILPVSSSLGSVHVSPLGQAAAWMVVVCIIALLVLTLLRIGKWTTKRRFYENIDPIS